MRPVAPEILLRMAKDCAAVGDDYPSWSMAEFKERRGEEVTWTMAYLGLGAWIGARGPEACLAFCLAATILEGQARGRS